MAKSTNDERLLQQMKAFAPTLVLDRLVGFKKDIGICLTSVPHPTEPKSTIAFFPALGLCCATLDYLASLYSGRIQNGPHVSSIVSYAKQYLPESFNEDVVRVLFRALRHSIAHQGIANRVWLEQYQGRTGRRISWKVYESDIVPAIQIIEEAGQVSVSPWPCHFTHRIHVHLGRLYREIDASGIAYARDLKCSTRLLRNFVKCMYYLYPE